MRLHRTGRTRAGLAPAFGLLLLSVWVGHRFAAEGVVSSPRRGCSVASTAPGGVPLRLCCLGCVRRCGAWDRIPPRSLRVELCRHRPWPFRDSCRAGCLRRGMGLHAGSGCDLLPHARIRRRSGALPRGQRATTGKSRSSRRSRRSRRYSLSFPLDIPGSFRAGAALRAIVRAVRIAPTNCLAVSLARKLASRSTLAMVAQAGAASALCFAAASAFTPHTAWRWRTLPSQLFGMLVIAPTS